MQDYYYRNYNGNAIITGIGALSKNVTIPSTINGLPVVGIDTAAAINNSIIETIDLGNNVLYLNPYAFENCKNLKSVRAPRLQFVQAGAFDGCIKLESLVMSIYLQTIGNMAFRNCLKITNFEVGKYVSNFGDAVFADCVNLASLSVEAGNTTYRAEGNCIIRNSDNAILAGCKTSVIPNSARSIADGAFFGHTGLTDITIPTNSVTSIGEVAFGQSGLVNITMPDGVTSIGVLAFYNCSSLISVTIGKSITSIGNSAFQGCTALTYVYIERTQASGITVLGSGAFDLCSNLSAIYVPDPASETAYKTAANWSSYASKIKSVPYTITITYRDGGGGTFSGTHAGGYPTIHTYGTATTLSSAWKTGYIFCGWYASSDCSGNVVQSLSGTGYTGNITLYAKWIDSIPSPPGTAYAYMNIEFSEEIYVDFCWENAVYPHYLGFTLMSTTGGIFNLEAILAGGAGWFTILVQDPSTSQWDTVYECAYTQYVNDQIYLDPYRYYIVMIDIDQMYEGFLFRLTHTI